MDILAKLFQKRGIKDINDLSSEEKQTFENYERVLSKRELTIDDIKQFLSLQIGIIESKWRDYEYKEKANLVAYHTIYKTLLEAIDAPEKEREQLEKYLIQLIT